MKLSHPQIGSEEISAVTRVLTSGQLSLGEETEKFEQEIASWVGAKYAVAVSSGTAGLHLAVLASDIQSGDEVITTPFSFVASTNAIIYERAKPVFVDIDPHTFNLDVNKIEAAITKKTRAILAVDIFGYPAEWGQILKLAKKHNLKIVQDAAEALGAKYQGSKVGSLGHPTVFAFYPNKQMTTGEGGMVVTNDKNQYHLMKGLANQGRGKDMQWLTHEYLGFNYRMSEIAAALGRVQLKKLDGFLAKRNQVAKWYDQRLRAVSQVTLMAPNDQNHQRSWFVYVVRLNSKINRDQVIERLAVEDIPAKAYLPSIHLQPYMVKKFGLKKGDLPVSEAVSNSTLALPLYTDMSEDQVEVVCQKLLKVLK
jgi:perosamine synthetase